MSVVQADAARYAVISEVHKICDALHFLEIG